MAITEKTSFYTAEMQRQVMERKRLLDSIKLIQNNAQSILRLSRLLMKDVESYQLLAQLDSYRELEKLISYIDKATAVEPYMPQTRGGNLFDYP